MSTAAAPYAGLAPRAHFNILVGSVTRVSRLVWLIAMVQAGFGLAAVALWLFRADTGFFVSFFQRQGSIFLTIYALTEYAFSLLSWRMFERGHPMRRAWLLITAGAGCRVAGLVMAIFAGGLGLSPAAPPAPANAHAGFIQEAGAAIGSPVSLLLLGLGLLIVIRMYRRVGLLRRPAASDWIALAIVGAYLAIQFYELARWIASPGSHSALAAVQWAADPLVGLLLLEAILLRRAVEASGGGVVAKCWGAYATAAFLTSMGALGLWTLNSGLIGANYSYFNAGIWFLAGIAFALGPAHQVEAVAQARRAEVYGSAR